MINKLLLPATLMLTTSVGIAQPIVRQTNEEAEAFVARIMPEEAELAHHVIETNRWCHPKKMVVACYNYTDSANRGVNHIEGHVYLPSAVDTYRDISFGPMEEDSLQIVSMFFANADADTTKELFVLCKYPLRNYDFEGTAYKTYIFDNPKKAAQLKELTVVSEKFYGMEGHWRDGKINRAKYKTAKDIKVKLRQMGY